MHPTRNYRKVEAAIWDARRTRGQGFREVPAQGRERKDVRGLGAESVEEGFDGVCLVGCLRVAPRV